MEGWKIVDLGKNERFVSAHGVHDWQGIAKQAAIQAQKEFEAANPGSVAEAQYRLGRNGVPQWCVIENIQSRNKEKCNVRR